MRTGDWVRCERDRAAIGTWPLYAGRVGRIVATNRVAAEYGVRFTGGARVEAWFLADELRVIERPTRGPEIRTHAEEMADGPLSATSRS